MLESSPVFRLQQKRDEKFRDLLNLLDGHNVHSLEGREGGAKVAQEKGDLLDRPPSTEQDHLRAHLCFDDDDDDDGIDDSDDASDDINDELNPSGIEFTPDFDPPEK